MILFIISCIILFILILLTIYFLCNKEKFNFWHDVGHAVSPVVNNPVVNPIKKKIPHLNNPPFLHLPDPNKTMNDIINSIKAHECEVCKTAVSVGINIAEGIADPEAEAQDIMISTVKGTINELAIHDLCTSENGLKMVDNVTGHLFGKKIEDKCLKENVCIWMHSGGSIVSPIKKALVTETCIKSNQCKGLQCI